MKTTIVIHITSGNEDRLETISEKLQAAGYGDVPSVVYDGICATTASDYTNPGTLEMIEDEVRALLDELAVGCNIDVVPVESTNVSDWAEWYGVENEDEDVVAAVMNEDMCFRNNPENIPDYIKDHYIGEFHDEEAMAEHLAEDDPEIQSLSDRVLRCLDLEEFYSDTIQYDMWNDGIHWFWN